MQKKEIIPTGIDCTPTHYLRANGLRNEAYPFDWTVTPLRSVVELIENGFQDFLEYKNLEFLPPIKRLLFDENGIDLKISNDIITPVICRRYGILFPHDFSEHGKSDYPKIKQKYDKRIERLKRRIATPQCIRFVYHTGRLNEWQVEQYSSVDSTFDNVNESEFIRILSRLEKWGDVFTDLNSYKAENLGGYDKIPGNS